MKKHSAFLKDQIVKCHNLLQDYVSHYDFTDRCALSKMYWEMDRLRIAIPSDIYQKISGFIESELVPAAYDDSYWSFLFTPDLGYIDNGVFHPYGKKQENQSIKLLDKKFQEIQDACLTFDSTELIPIIASETKEKVNGTVPSDSVKRKIMECYIMISDYLAGPLADKRESFEKLMHDVAGYRSAMPLEVYEKIHRFIDANISPLVYDKNVRDTIYTPDLGHFDKNGQFQPYGDEQLWKLFLQYQDKTFGIEAELRTYCMKELYPILTA